MAPEATFTPLDRLGTSNARKYYITLCYHALLLIQTPYLMPTCAHVIHWSSPIKAPTHCLFFRARCWWATRQDQINTPVLPAFKRSTHSYTFRWFIVRATYYANIRRWIWYSLTTESALWHVALRLCNRWVERPYIWPRCSLLPANRLNDGMLRAPNHTGARVLSSVVVLTA